MSATKCGRLEDQMKNNKITMDEWRKAICDEEERRMREDAEYKTLSEISDELGIPRRTTYDRIMGLKKSGKVECRRVVRRGSTGNMRSSIGYKLLKK